MMCKIIMERITITIPRSQITYPIFIGPGLIGKISGLINVGQWSSVGVITDKAVAESWLQKLRAGVGREILEIMVPSGEEAKTIDTISKIWNELLAARFDRSSLIVNLGGGSIGDAGGFAASAYMRGISYIHVPTTLLAQVDASIGGKTGIDFGGVKNAIGAICQPIAVVSDIETLSTLPDREFIAGWAEVIKHGLVADERYLSIVTSKRPREFSSDELVAIIKGSCKIKQSIVEKDEREHGIRRLLNFGHTIGHAIEALSFETDNPLLHGEAVAIGMAEEARISEDMGLLKKGDAARVRKMLKNAGLETAMPPVPMNRIMEKIASDKKSVNGKVRWTFLKKIGEGVSGVELNVGESSLTIA